jgi:hypothetical protein
MSAQNSAMSGANCEFRLRYDEVSQQIGAQSKQIFANPGMSCRQTSAQYSHCCAQRTQASMAD